MSTCLKHSTVVGCWNKADNTKENVVIHYTYATNASGVEILKAIRYTVSDGTPITLGVGDTVTPGACVVCRKEIFATHDRYITVPSAPAGFVAYEMTNDLPTQGLDVSNSYFHLIYPTLNGVTSDPIGPQLTEYFANPQNGILWSDIAGVQAVIDFVLPLMNLSVGDVVYAINTSNLPIFFLSPTAVAELANNTFLHIYWGSVDTHNNYNEKADVNVVAANPNILLGGENKCVGIQEIKEKDSCTGFETYRYVVEDGNGILVDVSTIIMNFDESNVLLKCPSIEYIPHQSGCIKRNTSALVQTCVTTTENFNFPSSEVYTQNKIADDGLGNYTIEVVGSTTLISTYSGMATTMLNPNSRMKENIGSGTLLFDFHNGNFSNTILINPNTFRFDLHFENGVTDIPTPLDSPCADPVPDSKYQSDAVFLINNVYNLMPLGVPQNSGGVNIDFVVTHYESKLLPSGNTFIYLPAKQFVYNDLEGTLIEEYRSIGEIQTLIEFNKVTDLFGNECEPEKLQIREKEVCGTIDGSTDTYELVRVYTRNPTTGASTILFYEDKFGNQITGVVVEVCCTCDTLCTVAPALPLLSSVTAYARSLTGQDGCGDKFVIGAGIQWQVKIYQNGALILNSTTSPILTSQAAAFTWLDSNAGGYWLNTTTLPWAFANNINTYQFVSPTDPDEYLMILTETGNGASYCGGNLTSWIWAFTNRGISFGANCDNADAFAWSDLWADRTGWNWKC